MPYGASPVPVQVTLDNGQFAFGMNFNTNNVIDPLDDETALTDLYFQSSTWNNLWDPIADTDFAFTFAAG